MAGRVFVTGGSGFVGSAVLDELVTRGYQVNALVHRRQLDRADVRSIPGGLFDDRALDEGIRGCDAIIHLVGIIMERPSKGITFERIHLEGTRRVVDAALRNGVKRYVHMSALGTRPDAVSDYHRTKHQAEEYARASGLNWTIFRPSFIHGPRGEFMQMEAKWARRKAPPFLFMPYFGAGLMGRGGAGHLQPVFVGDVARAFVDALEKPDTIGEVYPIGGPDVVTWPRMHHMVSEAIVGKKRAAVAVPVWKAKLLTHLLPGALLPFNRDQVIMSQEENTCDISKFVADFGWTPRSFEESVRSYAKEL
ncbi:MAG TPA: NAD-dependent epimerase/dehydratase family protein [Tepidisphaeraceae bacterium]|nr:NAD-dependent epimerase/dehydratase family protein [Tepidisphaeraceae bacterium]